MSIDLIGQLLKGLGGGTSGRPTSQASAGGEVIQSIFDMLSGPQGGQGASREGGQGASRASEGGLSDLVRSFDKEGLGDLMSSWIGTGENRAATSEQVVRGLGTARVQEAAQRSGLPMERLVPLLAAALPVVIDALTPKGQVPDQPSLQEGLQDLRGRLGRI
jgi:uncharacterized protein YidB (DUF937 family)